MVNRSSCRDPAGILEDLYKMFSEDGASVQAKVCIITQLASMSQLAGDFDRMVQFARPLLMLADQAQDERVALEARLVAANIFLHGKNRRIARSMAERQAATGGDSATGEIQSRLLRLMGNAHLHNGNLKSAIYAFERSNELAESIGAPLLLAAGLNDLAVANIELDDHLSAHAFLERALSLSEWGRNARLTAAVCNLNLAICLFEAGDRGESVALARRLTEEFAANEGMITASAHGILALEFLERRDVRAAASHVECIRRLRRGTNVANPGELSYVLIPMARVAEAQGRWAEAVELIDGNFFMASRIDVFWGLRLMLEKARLLRATDPAWAARTSLRVRRRAERMGAALVRRRAAELLAVLKA